MYILTHQAVTTTVTSDGRTQTSTHPYNPTTDPPIQSQQTSVNEDTSRTNTLGSTNSTNPTSTNPSSSTTIPKTQTYQSSAKLQPTPERPEVQRTISPGRKPTPQEMGGDSHFNIIPPTPQGSQSNVQVSPTTTGGRVIPPRSERRVSPNGDRPVIEPSVEFPLESPGPPLRSEKRNSIDRGLNVAPLKTNHSPGNSNAGSRPVSSGVGSEPRRSYEPPPVVPPKDYSETYFPGDRSGQSLRDSYQQQNQTHGGYDPSKYGQNPAHSSYDPSTYGQNQHHVANSSEPMAAGGINPDSRSHTPNYSRPGPTVTSPSNAYDAPPTSASAMHPPAVEPKVSHRQSLTNAFKGISGASEVLRGTINSGIAKGTHDKAEQERMRAIREQGMKDYKASGLQEKVWGGRTVERGSDGSRRLRKRSLSRNGVHGTEGPGGLEAVEERSIGS